MKVPTYIVQSLPDVEGLYFSEGFEGIHFHQHVFVVQWMFSRQLMVADYRWLKYLNQNFKVRISIGFSKQLHIMV